MILHVDRRQRHDGRPSRRATPRSTGSRSPYGRGRGGARRGCPVRRAWRSTARTSGSGRRNATVSSPASAKPPAENNMGPARSGMPTASATEAPGPVRLGPTTAPIVVDQTTRERARPTWPGLARSTAAKRDCRLAAVLAPNSRRPPSRIGSDSVSAPRMTTPAPVAPNSQPSVRAGRRPVRAAIDDSGHRERRGAERQHHHRHAGPAGRAADVLDQERPDREPSAVAHPADDLDEREDRDDPPLRRVRGVGHPSNVSARLGHASERRRRRTGEAWQQRGR